VDSTFFAVEGCGGGPSLRSKGGVVDFESALVWLEDRKRKAPPFACRKGWATRGVKRMPRKFDLFCVTLETERLVR
jgi:hypothetical protein